MVFNSRVVPVFMLWLPKISSSNIISPAGLIVARMLISFCAVHPQKDNIGGVGVTLQ